MAMKAATLLLQLSRVNISTLAPSYRQKNADLILSENIIILFYFILFFFLGQDHLLPPPRGTAGRRFLSSPPRPAPSATSVVARRPDMTDATGQDHLGYGSTIAQPLNCYQGNIKTWPLGL